MFGKSVNFPAPKKNFEAIFTSQRVHLTESIYQYATHWLRALFWDFTEVSLLPMKKSARLQMTSRTQKHKEHDALYHQVYFLHNRTPPLKKSHASKNHLEKHAFRVEFFLSRLHRGRIVFILTCIPGHGTPRPFCAKNCDDLWRVSPRHEFLYLWR